MARQFRIPFAGERVTTPDRRTWLRLTTSGAVLFGPGRAALIYAGRRGDRRLLHTIERGWARAASTALGMHIDIRGLDLVDPDERYVVTPLHESFADALCLLRLPLDLTFATRDELYEWRTLGPYLAASGQTRVPTADGPAAYRALLGGARDAFAIGESFVVFPQGTILGIEAAFRPGAFRIAERFGRPVLPVVISGTHRVWEHPYTPRVRTGVRVRVEVLDPIPAESIAGQAGDVEREMKQRAMASGIAPRRFEPDRDGWWDDYPYEIDGAFPELASRVAAHRSEVAGG
ncbi:MAG: hypothetical protein BMS9Abin07_0275 [Acidimicrobiia bacterium]|nr:MAG: hypothetical protein BMS9Abin07_0275 [Acidimicrobiia bacterium]